MHKAWGCAFKDAFSKTINLPMCKTLGGGDFTGEYIETVNIENAESIESTIDAEFINAFSLKNIYAPKLKQVPAFDFDDVGLQQIKNGKKPVIEYIYAPSATKFNYKRSNFKACDKLDFLFAPNLENISGYFYFPEKIILHYIYQIVKGRHQSRKQHKRKIYCCCSYRLFC